MKYSILLDSNFIIAYLDQNDKFHQDAIRVLKYIWNYTDKVKIIIPPLGLYEIIVSLKRCNIPEDIIKQRIMKLVSLEPVVITSISEMSAFKHCNSLLISSSKTNALRTNDFLITSLALDYEADILTFDVKMINKVKPIYPAIYYCSNIGKHCDDSLEFISLLDHFIEQYEDWLQIIK